MESIGLDLRSWMDKGLLAFDAARPTSFGLETHLVRIHHRIHNFKPAVVAIDPVTALLHSGTPLETRSMLLRLVDHLKASGITTVMTALTKGSEDPEGTAVDISSLVDSWLLLRDIETGGERNRGLSVLKARGLAHSNQIREFLLTDSGIQLRDVYLGEGGMVTGSARLASEARQASALIAEEQEMQRRKLAIERKRKVLEAQITLLQLELDTETEDLEQLSAQRRTRLEKAQEDRRKLARSRFSEEKSERARS